MTGSSLRSLWKQLRPWRELVKVWKNNPQFETGDYICFGEKHVLQIAASGGVEHKDAFKLHRGKCRIRRFWSVIRIISH